MIGYLDTSAFVPLLVAESGSAFCRRFWDDCDEVVTSRLLYIEAAAALARGERMGRLTGPAHRAAAALLDRLWDELSVVETDGAVIDRAAVLARRFALRGYDAVHCASAEQVEEADLVVASGDQSLLAACAGLGLATADTAEPEENLRHLPG